MLRRMQYLPAGTLTMALCEARAGLLRAAVACVLGLGALARAMAAAPAGPISTGQTPQHAVAADFNADGRTDLAVATAFDDRVTILLQDEQGRFAPSQVLTVGLNNAANQPRFLRVVDINSDGLPDLIVLCSGSFAFGARPSVQTLMNLGGGRFGRLPADSATGEFNGEKFPVQFVVGDFTADGYPDIVTANLDERSLSLLKGDGTGRFMFLLDMALSGPGGAGPIDLASADLNMDGRDDLIAVTATQIFIIRQTPGGGLGGAQPLPTPSGFHAFSSVALDDLDGDGRQDAAAADEHGAVVVWFGLHPMTNSVMRVETRLHPSLAGCSDVAAVPFDGDLLPDLAVCNRTGHSVTILGSSGRTQVFSTGLAPRRLELGDLNGDGRLDLITANEGDQAAPQNPDVSWIINPRAPRPWFEARLESEQALAPLFEGWQPWPAALTVPRERRFWLLDRARRRLMEFESDGEAGNGGTPVRQFAFEVGGVHVRRDDRGVAVERFTPRLHVFEIGENQEMIITFDYSPGELGFTGLTWDDDRHEYYVAAPARNAVVRLSESGQLLQVLAISPAAWDLGWDDEASRLLVTHPGRADVRAFTRTGQPDAGRSFDLRLHGSVFRAGLAGVAFEADHREIYVVATSGLLARLTRLGALLETGGAALLAGGGPLSFDADRGELYALSADGFVAVWREGEGEVRRRLSLWPAMAARPFFEPSGVCWDHQSDHVLVADRHRPMVAVFERDGVFAGFLDYGGGGGGPDQPVPRGALAVRPGDGSLFFHGPFNVFDENALITIPTPGTPQLDLALRDDMLLTGYSHPLEAVLTPYQLLGPSGPVVLPRPPSAVPLQPAAQVGGFAFADAGHLYRLTAGADGAPHLERWRFELVTAADAAWAQYE
ncbi:MAG: hypothetical protein Kow0059_19140 [Candidatus Sumerlaeia bacterium]